MDVSSRFVGFGREKADEAEVSVHLPEVETIPHNERVRDFEADIAERDLDEAPGGLVEQGADLDGAWVLTLEIAEQVIQGQAGVDDVLNEQNISAIDWRAQILEDSYQAGRFGCRSAVARDFHEVDPQRQVDAPHQVRHEWQGTLEDTDERQFVAGIVGADLPSELGHPGLDLLFCQQHLGNV